MLAELYQRPTRYELDVNDYERPRHQLMEYVQYRRKFEQNQLLNSSPSDPSGTNARTGVPSLNLQAIDPKALQQ
jgi:hypothetical protein